METKKRQKKSIEEQEQILQERLRILEAKKKQLAAIKDKRRTRRLILLGALFENILSDPGKNRGYYATRAKELYAKRPADLTIVLEFLEPTT